MVERAGCHPRPGGSWESSAEGSTIAEEHNAVGETVVMSGGVAVAMARGDGGKR